ncbi:MAG: hypothetical protein JWP52_289 [Rhizobacter sp.]|nr:hypothetical protein [Rhizobacter sp.]
MRLKTIARASAAAALAALVGTTFIGCGGDDNDNSGPPTNPPGGGGTAPVVQLLSSKPDYVSGSDTLVDVTLADAASTVTVALNGADVSSAFKADPNNATHRIGLVTGLKAGANSLVATSGGAATTLALTDYPITGPMISGPHETPFNCTTSTFKLPDGSLLGAPLDADCSVKTVVQYVYRPLGNTTTFKLLADPKVKPADVASVTNNLGRTVNYIVRVETGTINRSIYQLAILHDPSVDADAGPLAPPAGWNKKLIYPLGGGCQNGWYTQGAAIVSPLDDAYLVPGYGVATATLNTFGNNCNDLLAAETILMVKERFVKNYGVPTFTIGTGSSGGSYQSNQTADNYPGTFDGIVTGSSFPDPTTGFVGLADSRLLDVYLNVLRAGQYTDVQQKAISGYIQLNETAFLSDRSGTSSHSSRRMDPTFFFPDGVDVGVGPTFRYDPVLNPTGARGDVYDHVVNVYGRIPGTPGAGFAQRPQDNVGVQYGLKAYNDGVITFDQFADLNDKIGGVDIDFKSIPARTVGYTGAIHRAYAGGRILFGGNGLATTPVITRVGPGDATVGGNIHLKFWSFAIRERLIKANGNANNHVIVGMLAPMDVLIDQMDRWLTAIVKDTSTKTKAEKVAADKPADAVDACWTPAGVKIVEPATLTGTGQCNTLEPAGVAPNIVAGAPLSSDVIKCQLKPVTATDYTGGLTAPQMTRLTAIFPQGTCDWSKPGVEQVKAVPWASFGPSPVNLQFDVTKQTD